MMNTYRQTTEEEKMNRHQSPEFKELIDIQNQLPQTDILTITGFMNDIQFMAHLEVQRVRLEKLNK